MRASKVIDAVGGERLRFMPKQRQDNYGKAVGAADSRLPVDAIGTFGEGKPDFNLLSGDKHNVDFAAQSVNRTAWASIEQRYFVIGNEPKAGDLLDTLDQLPPVTYQVVDIVSDGPRYGFVLVRAS